MACVLTLSSGKRCLLALQEVSGTGAGYTIVNTTSSLPSEELKSTDRFCLKIQAVHPHFEPLQIKITVTGTRISKRHWCSSTWQWRPYSLAGHCLSTEAFCRADEIARQSGSPTMSLTCHKWSLRLSAQSQLQVWSSRLWFSFSIARTFDAISFERPIWCYLPAIAEFQYLFCCGGWREGFNSVLLWWNTDLSHNQCRLNVLVLVDCHPSPPLFNDGHRLCHRAHLSWQQIAHHLSQPGAGHLAASNSSMANWWTKYQKDIHLFAGRAVKRERRKGSSRRQQPAYGAAVNEVARELLRSARSPDERKWRPKVHQARRDDRFSSRFLSLLLTAAIVPTRPTPLLLCSPLPPPPLSLSLSLSLSPTRFDAFKDVIVSIVHNMLPILDEQPRHLGYQPVYVGFPYDL